MSRIYANPFFWGQPVSGNRYLQRPEEQKMVSSAIEAQTQLIISGRRGTGKTSLLIHLLGKSSVPFLYLDLRFVVSLRELNDLILQTLEAACPEVKQMKDFMLLKEQDPSLNRAHLFTFIKKFVQDKDQKFVIVWDEFHHVLKLKEQSLNEFKHNLGHLTDVTNIFISHRKDLLQEAFRKPGHRSFKKAEYLVLQGLDRKAFNLYLTRRFRRMGLNDFDLAESILKFTGCLPQLTQQLSHSLAQLWLEGQTTRLLDRTLRKMLQEHNALFSAQWDKFGLNERRLLLGLADGHSRPTELGFINRYNLSATSTAHNTALKLIREGWLINRDEGYYLYDPLFHKWLKNRNGIA